MISVISDCVLATVRTLGVVSVALMMRLLHSSFALPAGAFCPPATMELWAGLPPGESAQACCSSFGNPRQLRKSSRGPARQVGAHVSKMDKIAGLKEILALDSKNSFARYGLAMELAAGGETDAALAEFSVLLADDPSYTVAYFMSAQTLASAGRIPEAIARLRSGISCATQSGNSHAVSQMQALLDELDR
jgi:hypothetical protein